MVVVCVVVVWVEVVEVVGPAGVPAAGAEAELLVLVAVVVVTRRFGLTWTVWQTRWCPRRWQIRCGLRVCAWPRPTEATSAAAIAPTNTSAARDLK